MHPRHRGLPLAPLAAALYVLLCACGGARWGRAAARGPIVLISFEALRADAATGFGGPPGLTPHLEALSRRMSWAGTAVASSSRSAPALASLLTGLSVWQHQVLQTPARLDSALWTMAEALGAAGYPTTAFRGVAIGRGWAQGFDEYRELGGLHSAKEHLGGLSAAPSFTWIHIEMLGGTLIRHDQFLGRLRQVPPDLPVRLGAAARGRQAAKALDPEERARLWALYSLNIAAADEVLGTLIAALESSGQWERSTVAVTGTQGLALGDFDPARAGPAETLGLTRSELETPLMLKLPPGSPAVAVQPGQRVALARLWSTLVEAAGGVPPAAVAPSLLREAPAGALSALYAEAGANSYSWVDADTQLVRSVPLGGSARALARRVPFTGSGPASLRLLRWTSIGIEETTDDSLRARMASEMEREFYFFLEQEPEPDASRQPSEAPAAPGLTLPGIVRPKVEHG